MQKLLTFPLMFGLFLGACGENKTTVVENVNQMIELREAPVEECPLGGTLIVTGFDTNDNDVLDDDEISNVNTVCNGNDGNDGDDGETSLIRTTDEPAGANCGQGGVRIQHGIDGNGNGLLDDDEVDGTEYVCNGLPGTGTNSLVNVVEEASGANCASGGFAIHSGMDTSGDSLLQPQEITSTVYVCNGTNGSVSLVRREDEPAGANCQYGGQLVQSGLDSDDNGVLDDMEASSSFYVCNGADGADGVDATENLIDVLNEPVGISCPTGGVRVLSGPDDDGDGVLDAGEVQAQRVICNGATGATGAAGADGGIRVLRATNAARGGVCFFGGVKLDTGIDDNDNGVLDDLEVDQTQYVCNLPDIFVSLSAGGYGACALKANATVWCWGNGNSLGNGVYAARANPVQVEGVTSTVSQVSHGLWHSCMVSSTNSYCCGNNVQGQLGTGNNTYSSLPAQVTGFNPIQISAGDEHTCGVGSTGAVYCWGKNTYGQLGNNTTTNSNTPVLVSGLSTGVSNVQAGGAFSCAQKTDGAVWCWGYNNHGQLGNNTTTNSSIPVPVSGLTAGVQALSTGGFHACAIRANNAVWCWGFNTYGQLGDGTTIDKLIPVWTGMATLGMSVASVSTGASHTCARHTSGALYCMGLNSSGQIGDGTTLNRLNPVTVSGMSSGVLQFSLGSSHSCALKTDGSAWCWGAQVEGALGNGLFSGRSLTPTPVLPSDSAL